jgi:hypothetical protein
MALPVTFVAGDVLEAAQLNSNFTYLETASGLNLVTKTAFTTTATWVLDNIFTSAYDNYRIDIVWTQLTSTANYAGFQMRVGGVASTTSYQYANAEANNGGVTGRYSTTASYIPVLDSTSADIAFQAQVSQSLNLLPHKQLHLLVSTSVSILVVRGTAVQGFHNVATSYDGIQIANGSTASGTVYVYGLAK